MTTVARTVGTGGSTLTAVEHDRQNLPARPTHVAVDLCLFADVALWDVPTGQEVTSSTAVVLSGRCGPRGSTIKGDPQTAHSCSLSLPFQRTALCYAVLLSL